MTCLFSSSFVFECLCQVVCLCVEIRFDCQTDYYYQILSEEEISWKIPCGDYENNLVDVGVILKESGDKKKSADFRI